MAHASVLHISAPVVFMMRFANAECARRPSVRMDANEKWSVATEIEKWWDKDERIPAMAAQSAVRIWL